MREARLGCVFFVVIAACSRDRRPVPGDAGIRKIRSAELAPRFSRPIAAVHLADTTIVAGLAVPSASIVAGAVGPDGAFLWTTPAVTGVHWGPNAELRAVPAGGNAGIIWRGQRSGKGVTQMALLGTNGQVLKPPTDVGPAACATEDGVAWIDRGRDGVTHVRQRMWSTDTVDDLTTLAKDRDPELVCGGHRAFALGVGEDDLTVAIVSRGGTSAPVPVLRDRDFPGDEEREHDVYTVSDTLGILRVGESGGLAVREFVGDTPTPWRRLTTKVMRDDDVVAVDADARALIVVFTRDEGDRCGGAPALSIHALVARRSAAEGGADESEVELAPVDCDHDPSPFWTGAVDHGFVVAWVERGHKVDALTAPIAGLAYRLVGESPLAPLQRTSVAADELVSAGCDKARCYAAALIRSPGTDDTQPEAIRLVTYP